MSAKESVDKMKALPGKGLVTLVDFIIEEAVIITQSKLSYFALMNKDESVLTMIGWSKTVMENCAMIDKPIVYPIEATGLWGDCVRERKPVMTNDYKSLKKPTKKGYPAGHIDVVRHFNVPVTQNGHIVGVLGVGNKEKDYTQDDIRVLQEFANSAYTLLPKNQLEAIVG